MYRGRCLAIGLHTTLFITLVYSLPKKNHSFRIVTPLSSIFFFPNRFVYLYRIFLPHFFLNHIFPVIPSILSPYPSTSFTLKILTPSFPLFFPVLTSLLFSHALLFHPFHLPFYFHYSPTSFLSIFYIKAVLVSLAQKLS